MHEKIQRFKTSTRKSRRNIHEKIQNPFKNIQKRKSRRFFFTKTQKVFKQLRENPDNFKHPRENAEDLKEHDGYDFGEEDSNNFENQPIQFDLKSKKSNQDDNPDKASCRKCGRSSFEKGGRVKNGEMVKPLNKYPWVVPLFNKTGIRCGGAVISKKYVLTAAHCLCRIDTANYRNSPEEECLPKPKDYYIKLLGKEKLGKTVQIKKIIQHPEFDYSKVINDIALLELAEELECNEMTSPICLPTKKELYEDGQNLYIARWATLTRLSESISQFHCAVGTNQSACQGDSGSSTFINHKNRFYTLGVVSHGKAARCIPEWPTVFSKTLYFLDWIKEHVEDLPKP
ncbi:serine protease grass [Trichonephila inaurata madagascariensis]|uniref:Serine protease grass n=1 Tax=Trichonephila inaurata madagascariensis TaxID=2747483 RepID=A0A8X6XVZ8_9ARAC|nr:serine protease grass [Trichonephila inaurata madagascariensis]